MQFCEPHGDPEELRIAFIDFLKKLNLKPAKSEHINDLEIHFLADVTIVFYGDGTISFKGVSENEIAADWFEFRNDQMLKFILE